jgi:hypothetical protein
MNEVERLNLQKMIQANDTEDNTPLIRDLKHSTKILEGVEVLLKLKRENTSLAKTDPKKFDSLCVEQCGFLFNHYTDIFNKVKKDEINLTILLRLLNVLNAIEEGNVDQHEGSFEVGKLLKKIYIDSALRKADKLDEANKEQEEKKPTEQISWAEFKNKKNC